MTAGETLVYDGDCGFCTQTALWVARRAGPNVEVVPWQSLAAGPGGLASYSLSERDVTEAAWWLVGDNQLRGARAVAAALRACGGFWKVLGRLIDLPPVRPLAALGYRIVARNRYRLPGSTCEIPPRT